MKEGMVKRDRKRNMQNRQIDKKKTKHVRIDIGLHKLLKIKAAKSGMTIKTLLEGHLADLLAVAEENKSTSPTIDYFKEKYSEKSNDQIRIL